MLTEQDKIKHLYHRAAFGLTVSDWQTQRNLKDAIEALFHPEKKYHSFETITLAEVEEARQKIKSADTADKKDLKQMLKKNVFELNHQWLDEMIHSDDQLREKLALFWHGHFACRSVNPYFDQQYLDVIRKNALGNFPSLLLEVSKTPAMLQFLNNQQNKKGHPNENFAREVMELFTLGHGNYTEQDIREAARAFTGFGFDMTGQFKFKVQQHDFGTKTFLGKTGDFSGEDILKIILEKRECAYFITKKMYRFFVNDTIDESVVKPLADKFYESGYDIKSLLKEFFSTSWFYDEKNVGVKIKSPIDLLAGMFRIIPTTFDNDQSTLFIQRALGQILLNPPNVAGWSGGRSWIDSSSLLFRMRLPQIIYYDKELDFSPKDMPEDGMKAMKMAGMFIQNMVSKKLNASSDWSGILAGFSQSTDVVTDASRLMLSRLPDAAAMKCIETNSDTSSKENKIKSTVIDILSLPDYQLC